MDTSGHISSSYWRVPDDNQYLTAIASHPTQPLIAVGSGSQTSNLFIYGVEDGDFPFKSSTPALTHHQTITLGGIHSLDWASPNQTLGSQGNVVATGHNNGVAHLILLPDPSSNSSAEILRRFNHTRHIQGTSRSNRIKHLQLAPDVWTCGAPSSLLTLCGEYLFMWDPARSDRPILRKKCKAVCFDASQLRDGVVGIGGPKGICIKDVRFSESGVLAPSSGNDGFVTSIKWSPYNENLISSVHDGSILKVWDIRNQKPLETFDGHTDQINHIYWNPSSTSQNEILSASSDGTIRTWHIETESKKISDLNIVENDLSSTMTDKNFEWIQSNPWRIYKQRMSRYTEDSRISYDYFVDKSQSVNGSTIFSTTKQFMKLTSVITSRSLYPSLISIDSEGYFGLHTKEIFSFELGISDTSDIQTSEDDSNSFFDDIDIPSTSPVTSLEFLKK